MSKITTTFDLKMSATSNNWRRSTAPSLRSPDLRSIHYPPIDNLRRPPSFNTATSILGQAAPPTELQIPKLNILKKVEESKTEAPLETRGSVTHETGASDDPDDDTNFIWEEHPTYFLSCSKQCSRIWTRKRIGRITMSLISAAADRNRIFYPDPSELARIIVGLSSKSFTPNQKVMTEHGIVSEPIIRDWYATQLNRKITEVGLAVWKEDVRFGGSLDGKIGDLELSLKDSVGVEKTSVDSLSLGLSQLHIKNEREDWKQTHISVTRNSDSEEGLEIKAPKKMYNKLITHIEAIRKGFNPPPGYHRHLFDSHYDQMTGNGVITGMKYMHFVAVSTEENLSYCEKLPVDRAHWDTVLYPQATYFYDNYIQPLMVSHNIRRIDPPSTQSLPRSASLTQPVGSTVSRESGARGEGHEPSPDTG